MTNLYELAQEEKKIRRTMQEHRMTIDIGDLNAHIDKCPVCKLHFAELRMIWKKMRNLRFDLAEKPNVIPNQSPETLLPPR
jgi:hypothetical protein